MVLFLTEEPNFMLILLKHTWETSDKILTHGSCCKELFSDYMLILHKHTWETSNKTLTHFENNLSSEYISSCNMLFSPCTLTDLFPMSKCIFKVTGKNTVTRSVDAVVASLLLTLNIYFSDGIFVDKSVPGKD